MGNTKDAKPTNDTSGTVKRLTVEELRQRLAGFDANAFVLLPGQEGGFHAIGQVQAFDIMMDVNKDPLFGPHDVPGKRQRPDARAVVLLGGRPGKTVDKS